MVSLWSELWLEVVETGTIAMFKKHWDRYMNRIGLEEYMGQMQSNGISLVGGMLVDLGKLDPRACFHTV